MASSNLRIAFLFIISIALIAFLITSTIKSDSHANGLSKDDVNQLIGAYIQENPQKILESLTKYQIHKQKQQKDDAAKNVIEKIDELENNPLDPIAGNPKGDITIVEFFDYTCGYCKKVFPYINQLLKEDENLKVVFKELPILGPNSMAATEASLAVNNIAPDKYLEFHTRLMASRVTGKASVLKIASDIGLDSKQIEKKMASQEVQSQIANNKTLADSIGVNGTPALVIGGQFVPGAIDYNTFKQMIAEARKKK